eukprot:6459024-Amphidinium_carterae.1
MAPAMWLSKAVVPARLALYVRGLEPQLSVAFLWWQKLLPAAHTHANAHTKCTHWPNLQCKMVV